MDWVFMEITVAWTAAVDVLPRVGGIEGQLCWRKTDHWAVDIVQLLDVEWQATPNQMVAERDGRDAIEKRSRILGQWVKEQSVDDVGDEIYENLDCQLDGYVILDSIYRTTAITA